MRKHLIVIFSLITFNLIGQETKFPKQELKVDLDSLVSYIEQVHVNPYTCIPKEKFYRNIELCKKNLTDSTSIIKYFTLISPIISSLNDGHTVLSFPYTEWKKINPFCFPFNPKISTDGKLYTPEYLTELPKNVEIISINGIPTKQIVDKLIGSISGESKSFRLAILQKSFVERFGAFYGFKTSYLIKYTENRSKASLTISGIKLIDLLKSIKQNKLTAQTNSNSRDYEYKTLNDGKTGIIDFKSFSDLNLFKHFLDSVFTQIKHEKTENLIIDLRNNGGGNSALGDELFQYISKVPFEQFGKITVKYSRIRAEFYTQSRETGFLQNFTDSTFSDFIAPTYGTTETSNNELTPLRENKLRFNGNIYLLTSTNTFSSASDFAWCFHYFNMGKIIGEETGGYIVCFGDLINATLPVTKLSLNMSHKEFYGYGATPKERHGVFPDYKTEADNALNFALNLIDNAPNP